MSGTSVDGIDVALAEISGWGSGLRARLRHHEWRPFPAPLRKRVLNACLEANVAEICRLNFLLGERFAEAALHTIRAAGVRPQDIACIGSHGQTVHHL